MRRDTFNKMKTVIIEDETVAAQTLQALLQEIDPAIEVLAMLQSIEESVEWFTLNPPPDLAFMDIHLADGSSFAIFNKAPVTCPVIFTTAYDEYALKAFEVKSIDYLLKPIGRIAVERALSKFKSFAPKPQFDPDLLKELVASMKENSVRSKSNFLIPHKDKLIPLSVDKIAFMFAENKMISIHTFEGAKHHIDSSLDVLYRQLDAAQFFRANRQYVIARKAIKDMSQWFGSKLSVNLTVAVPERIIISKVRVSEFKKWFTM